MVFSSERVQRFNSHNRERATKYGADFEYVELDAVWAKTAGACWVCSRPTDPRSLGADNPLAFEPDHVYPISKGGPHNLVNLWPSCAECNGAKGDQQIAVPAEAAPILSSAYALQLRLLVLEIPALVETPSIGPRHITFRARIGQGAMDKAVRAVREIRSALDDQGAMVYQSGSRIVAESLRSDPRRVELDAGLMPHVAGDTISIGIGRGADYRQARIRFSPSSSPHLLGGGQTGGGKSTLARTLVYGLCASGAVDLAIADADVATFDGFERAPGLIAPIAEKPAASGRLIRHVADILEARDPRQRPRPLVLVVDEVAALNPPDVETLIALAGRGRRHGVYCVLFTQYIHSKIISRFATDQFGWRIALRVEDVTSSRQVIKVGGAERLAGKGDALLAWRGQVVRFQVAATSPDLIAAMPKVDPPELGAEPARQVHPSQVAEDDTDLVAAARELGLHGRDAIRQGLRVGQGRAGRIRDQVVGAPA